MTTLLESLTCGLRSWTASRWLIRGFIALSSAASSLCCAPAYSDADPTGRAFETLTEWDATVGVLRPGLTVAIRDGATSTGEFRQGQALCADGRATITLYRGTFERDAFDAEVRHVMLHELVHVHLHCNDSDHSADPSALMYRESSDANVDADVAPADVALIREAWIR